MNLKKGFVFHSYSILWCSYECGNPCPYVSLLRAGCLWAKDPEILVVEEVSDNYPNGILTLNYCAVIILLSRSLSLITYNAFHQLLFLELYVRVAVLGL